MTTNAKLCGIAIASAIALTTAPAWAQSAPSNASPKASLSQSHPLPMRNPLAMEDVTRLPGIAVYDRNDEKIGRVSAVLMNPKTKAVDRLVVRGGGFLGFGSRAVALPLSAFHWDPQDRDFRIAETADNLKTMPEWQRPQMAEAPSDAITIAPGDAAVPPAPVVQ